MTMDFLLKSLCSTFVLLIALSKQPVFVHATTQQFPCFFIFGDSLVDNGNNNGLDTRAKVNYPPYGIDFPDGPTGRFTNGKTMVDILGQFLGFHEIKSFATAKASEIVNGVNYASGSAGIQDQAGSNLGVHVSFNQQLKNHQITISNLAKTLNESTAAHLQKCLYYVGFGSNDYLNDYFLPGSNTSHQFNPDQFAGLLVDQYAKQIRSLLEAGARKIALFGLGPIGCIPNSIALFSKNGSCVANMNIAVELFNGRLNSLADQLSKDLTDSKVIHIKMPGAEALKFAEKLGFKGLMNGKCCQVNGDGQCIPNSTPCENRNLVTYWDAFHPTETVNKIQALFAFKKIMGSLSAN